MLAHLGEQLTQSTGCTSRRSGTIPIRCTSGV
jgi:hypothetical protein